jgi:SlyX protein
VTSDDRDHPELIELQIKVAYQERTLGELNEALIDQSRSVLELIRRVEALEKVVKTLAASALQEAPQPPNERPPHY